MAWRCSGDTNDQLVANLYKANIIKSKEVLDALKRVDRRNYVLRSSDAYSDSPQSIGYGATISAPHMHAMCLELMLPNLQNGSVALDVGSGSGYLVAAMAQLVKPKGKIYGIDHVKELVDFSVANIRRDDEKLLQHLDIKVGDGRQGWAEKGPFDAIHVGAASVEIPDALKKQLKIGGRLVIPVGRSGDQQLLMIERVKEKEWKSTDVCGVEYIPLTDKEKQLK